MTIRSFSCPNSKNTFLPKTVLRFFYRYRPAADGSSDKAIVLFHRGHEHSGRMMFERMSWVLMILPILLGTRVVMVTALVNVAIVRVLALRLLM